MSLRPRQPAFLHHLDITHLAEMFIQPFGYLKSAPVSVPALSKAADASPAAGTPRYSHHPTRTVQLNFLTQCPEVVDHMCLQSKALEEEHRSLRLVA